MYSFAFAATEETKNYPVLILCISIIRSFAIANTEGTKNDLVLISSSLCHPIVCHIANTEETKMILFSFRRPCVIRSFAILLTLRRLK